MKSPPRTVFLQQTPDDIWWCDTEEEACRLTNLINGAVADIVAAALEIISEAPSENPNPPDRWDWYYDTPDDAFRHGYRTALWRVGQRLREALWPADPGHMGETRGQDDTQRG